MPWYAYLAHFFGGVFLANAIPHLVAGISGNKLQTPFATPPARGLSSPQVNVGWALFNLAVAYLLLIRVRSLDLHSWPDAIVAFAGFGLMAVFCAGSFVRARGET